MKFQLIENIGCDGMRFLANVAFFIRQYCQQLKKKWLSLLLLFLFPVMIISLVLTLFIAILLPSEQHPIRVALVDLDQTEETALFRQLLEDAGTENAAFDLFVLQEAEAQQQIANNELSAYFIFPEQFTKDLYEGESVAISIVGNAERPVESFIVKQLLDSMTTYISSAQANILTINEYAKKTSMSTDERMELLYKQFIDFALYTLGKDQLVKEIIIKNIATTSPFDYYIVAGFFMMLTIWMFGFLLLVKQEEPASLEVRMKLLGVSITHRLLARMVVSICGSILLTIVGFILLQTFASFELISIDYARLFLFVLLYYIALGSLLLLVEQLVPSEKLQLVFQCFVVLALLFASGALIPTAYFALSWQAILPFIFSYEVLQWMTDILLEGRNFATYSKLLLLTSTTTILFFVVTNGKERWQR